ncbi:iron-siderophore ABC transporter substrate-binding protein [Saccharomonospora halophila]|uniref:iron-siderophore ABC transporter substrate-binding protein n=1 Tax=Saccharomonospora halophila TaxID=129922 RepID=UPI000584BBD1|nr:iron-siderophore ABC transporter substrate-binding protein [Saccharomonospora halophila]
MSHVPTSRRRPVVSALLAAFALLTAACSNTPEERVRAEQADRPTVRPEPGALPVTLEHRYGSTTIERAPQRVVTVGYTDQDALIALGVVPVATTHWLGDHPGALGPWAQDALGEAPTPEVLRDRNGIRFEKIADLDPDLIVGLYSAMSAEDYAKLSRIAPTVAPPRDHADYGIPWQELTTTVGKAVGKPAEARRLVADVEDRFARSRREHPEFDGASAVVAAPHDGYFVYGRSDHRSRILTELGFSLPPDLDRVVDNEWGANLSRERADLLDTDVIVWRTGDAGARLREDPLYNDLPVAQEKREVLVDETGDHGAAFSHVSVLSLPYLLDWLTPRLSAAVDGDPATIA